MRARIPVRRVDYGYFVRPGSETPAGHDRLEPVLGYLIEHPDGAVLVDTGMGDNSELDAHYRPRRIGLEQALTRVGSTRADITLVVNCHLHFDHCGGNPALPGRPIVVQHIELETAKGPDYTLPELVDAPGLTYTELTGEAEVRPGVLVVPTPGHVEGHQSVLVTMPDRTVVVIAGQSQDTATAYGADALAVRAAHDRHPAPLPPAPKWMDRLVGLDPARVYFAHDHAVWVP